MAYPHLKIVVRIGLTTAGLVFVYELSNLLLIYRYFKFEYYMAGVALIALVTGVILTRIYYRKTHTSTATNAIGRLTNKELRVLILISEGKSNKEIASLNFVEISTVKTHINNMYAKLGVNNRKGAVEIYRKYLFNQKSTFSPPVVI